MDRDSCKRFPWQGKEVSHEMCSRISQRFIDPKTYKPRDSFFFTFLRDISTVSPARSYQRLQSISSSMTCISRIKQRNENRPLIHLLTSHPWSFPAPSTRRLFPVDHVLVHRLLVIPRFVPAVLSVGPLVQDLELRVTWSLIPDDDRARGAREPFHRECFYVTGTPLITALPLSWKQNSLMTLR